MLALSIIIVCLAHVLRVIRWELLIKTYEKPDGIRLTKALSIGYFLNYFLPLKLGDLGRALYAGTSMINGRGFALATVVIERCLDILTVGLIFVVFSLFKVVSVSTAIYYIVLAVLLFIILLIILFIKNTIKKVIFAGCSLLNAKYEEKMLRFFWALIWGFKDILNKIPKIKLIMYTVAMWVMYLLSYSAFSVSLKEAGLNSKISDVLLSLFDQKSLLSSGIVNGVSLSSEMLHYGVFLLAPSFVLFIVAFILGRFVWNSGEKNRLSNINNELNLIPQTNTDERRRFLEMYFAGERREYVEKYLKINRNILVLRDYSAGSNATTILCTDGKKSFYRKYAFSEAASKLKEQVLWIENNKDLLPLTGILRHESGEGFCYYDMEYSSDAVTLFEYLQDGDLKKGFEVLKNVLNILEDKLYSLEHVLANESEVRDYVEIKAINNYNAICNHKEMASIIKCDTVFINGKEYPGLKSYGDILSKENLIKVFGNDVKSRIHGDLTIENIVYVKEKDNFYLIDPNGGNILDSKFIDYAKVLQSLHGKYEYLMAVNEVSVNGNHIDFNYVDSYSYDYMYNEYCKYLEETFTKEEIAVIYYHEVVNWLRLMPYKLDKGVGMLFYAGLLVVLKDLGDRVREND